MIPTHEIQALRDRAAIAAAPLPYQQARLLPKLRRDRPLRFRVVVAHPATLAAMLSELDHSQESREPLLPFVGLIGDLGQATDSERAMQLPAHWPAAQIVELCNAVLEHRENRAVEDDIARTKPLSFRDFVQSSEGFLHKAVMESMARSSPGTITHLEDELMSLPFITDATVESNPTLSPVAAGIPPKSVRITLTPETVDADEIRQIASTIYAELPVGVGTCGESWVLYSGSRIAWDWSNSEFIGLLDAMRLFKRQSKS